jgi:hypothetical protein
MINPFQVLKMIPLTIRETGQVLQKQCPEDFKLGQFQVKGRKILFNQRTNFFQQEDMTKLKRGQNYSITRQMRKNEDIFFQKQTNEISTRAFRS